LLTKNRISEAEQSRAFIRGFQPDLWHRISCRLENKLPDHDPDNFYSLVEINEAAKHVLHGTSQNSFLQNSVTSTAPPTQLASPYVKAEDLLMLFEQMTQTFLKMLMPQKSTTSHASSSTNAQATTTLDPLSCQTGHFIANCSVCADYITNEKCKRNPEGKIVLPNGQYTPRSIPGWYIKDRIDEWHKRNPVKSTSSSLMYEINPVAVSSQTSVSTNMVSTSSTNVFTADQRIAALEQEIFNLRYAKRTFDGVEIPKPARTNKPNPTEQPKAPESTTKPVPPPEKPTPMTQPLLHPFANVPETSYPPSHERNTAAALANPAQDKEPAYHSEAPVQTPRTVVDIYNKSMQTPHITLSSEDLFAISPELCNRLHEDITPKQVLNEMVSTHTLVEQVPDEVSSIKLNMQLVNNKTHVIWYPEQSTFLCVYFSICDLPDLKSTFYITPHTPADSLTFASDHPAPYTNLILSTQRKYKHIATKVRPVLGDLPEKFHIEREIINNPFDDLPVLYPDSPPFVTTDFYTLT
jgi:hypothetical protein